MEKGIIINGLPIMVKEPSYSTMDIDNLDLYYEDCVIGGPGSFVVTIKERDKFKEAIRTKLLLEVAGRTPERPVVPAAGTGAARQLHDRREDLAGPVGEVRSRSPDAAQHEVMRCEPGSTIASRQMGPGSAEQRLRSAHRVRDYASRYRLNRATNSTCGVWRNWSTGVTPSIL